MNNIPSSSAAPAAAPHIRVLHLEDSAVDAALIHDILEQEGIGCDITQVPNRVAYEALLDQQTFDIVLCDHGLPGYDGFTALHFARSHRPETPVIMISGSLDDGQAVESLKNGATDYILKQRLARLAPRRPPRPARGRGAPRAHRRRRARPRNKPTCSTSRTTP